MSSSTKSSTTPFISREPAAVRHGGMRSVVAGLLLCALVFSVDVSPAAGESTLSVFEGEQVDCDPSRACHPVRLELDRDSGTFAVIKGSARSCVGTAPPQPAEIEFVVLCDGFEEFDVTARLLVRERANGDLVLRMEKRRLLEGSDRPMVRVVRAVLTPVP